MSVADLRAVEVAAVMKGGALAAELTRQAGGVAFSYLPDYQGPPIATSLPLTTEPRAQPGGALPPFFSGLLPEGRRLEGIRNAVKTSADDELSLLLAIGADLVGDVQALPKGQKEPDAMTEIPPALEEVSFGELFERAVGPGLEDPAAIAGVQDKVSSRMVSLPVAHQNAHWILKLDPPSHQHLVANEAFFLTAGRESGVATAEAHVIHDRDRRPGLLVKRFDRVVPPEGGQPTRLPQEDACQVLGLYPADKYRITTEQVVQGLAQRTGAPIVAARALLQQFAFAYITCNGDAHGKNSSILHNGNEWRVTPAYDLPSTHPYGDTSMALSLNGKNREDITRTDFIALGEACSVPPKATARLLDQLIAAAPKWMNRLDDLPFDNRKIHRLRRACTYRIERLR